MGDGSLSSSSNHLWGLASQAASSPCERDAVPGGGLVLTEWAQRHASLGHRYSLATGGLGSEKRQDAEGLQGPAPVYSFSLGTGQPAP